MASRLLSRSKALALALSRSDAAAPPAAPAGARWLRTLSSLPRDPAAPAAPAPRQPTVGSPLGLSKIPGYEHAYRLSGTQVLPRWFSTGASNGSSQQGGTTTKVTAFSPLEASIVKPRSGPLTNESFKVRRKQSSTLIYSKSAMVHSLVQLSESSDVYSFGDFLLEFVTGKEAASLISSESREPDSLGNAYIQYDLSKC
ncbi:hypothetical protein GUJ93_ZPchr0007g3093 [Zizania palustris]|uniref:Uncharacterized protein n=1 Tax=Zizania palustris TaxID=103762 RepID=A0A8J5SRU8_ZIZPA|nr:hypothetical protein GUJ93_ZPchr0007g3093 [Zizania palustris]